MDTRPGVRVELRRASKQYGGITAVRDVTFDIEPGSVHALVGENGAGKSTVSKMIAGVVAPSAGEVVVDGEPVWFGSPRRALAAGIALIDQELATVPARSVIDNIFLGAESGTGGVLRIPEQRARYADLIARTGFVLDRDAPMRTLRVAEQQQVEILRALSRDARFIIMDEPTAALTVVESQRLYDIIANLKAQGTTILYISHFLGEVLRVADTVTVMRDGRHVSTAPASAHTEASLVHEMLGRALELTYPQNVGSAPDAAPVLRVEGLTSRGRFADIHLDVRPGEILGIAGLIGSGRTELLRAIAGCDPRDDGPAGGSVRLDGEVVQWRSPRDAIADGVVLLPESRRDDGLVMNRSIEENIVISGLGAVSSWGVLRGRRQHRAVARLMEDLDVRASTPRARVSSLSGGNQQKVMFAKCLMTRPRVLLIDEPTRGVDVGAKQAIYELVVSLADEGMAIVVVSSELDEVLGLADRVMVMRRGRIAAEFPAADATEERVLTAAFGTAERQPTPSQEEDR